MGSVFEEVGGWPGVLARLMGRHHLDESTASAALGEVLAGRATDAQIAAFIVALRLRGETAEEVAGLVGAMLDAAAPLDLGELTDQSVDIVGTGGSRVLGGAAFNVSTMAAIVTAAAGVPVCKHGNRKASSASGSTDLLEALGVNVELDGPEVAACVRGAGVGFAFARRFHPAMRHVAPVRAELGVPTVFNVLGPLSHPGRVRRQVLGVSDARLLDLVPEVLARRGVIHALVVHGSDGLDELTVTGPTVVVEVRAGQVERFEVRPGDVGLPEHPLESLALGGPEQNAIAARALLAGEAGPVRDMVVFNAGAALHVGGAAADLAEGARRAAAAIDDGRAAATLERLVELGAGFARADGPVGPA